MKKIHLDKNWGVFVGSFEDNKLHRHYAIQLSIRIHDEIKVIDSKGKEFIGEFLAVKDNELHRLECSGDHILILFNPFSTLGHYIQNQIRDSIEILELDWSKEIKTWAEMVISDHMSFDELIDKLNTIWKQLDCSCENENHVSDLRIAKAIAYIEKHSLKIISVNEIAEHVNLSTDRFLHLFKNVTGMNYRRAQLWNKIQGSLPDLREHSITETAYKNGFSDSAHYTRTFKENFGFSPKFISKI